MPRNPRAFCLRPPARRATEVCDPDPSMFRRKDCGILRPDSSACRPTLPVSRPSQLVDALRHHLAYDIRQRHTKSLGPSRHLLDEAPFLTLGLFVDQDRGTLDDFSES